MAKGVWGMTDAILTALIFIIVVVMVAAVPFWR